MDQRGNESAMARSFSPQPIRPNDAGPHHEQNKPQPHNDHPKDDTALAFGQSSQQRRMLIEQEWERASLVLKSNPSLMTSRVFLLTLHNKPPLHVVQFMLEINPQAASFPKEGPTPLEIAIKHHASIEVILLLLQACPFALVATDMAEIARQAGRESEQDLMDAMLKPLNYWLAESSKLHEKRASFTRRQQKQQYSRPGAAADNNNNNNNNAAKEPQEKQVNDVRAIASTIIKAHKRQNNELAMHRHELETKLVDAGTDLVKQLEDRQRRHFKSQLVALDMKEKSLQHQHRAMERRIIKSLEMSKKKKEMKDRGYVQTIHKLESKITQLENRLEQECRVNTFFRSDTRLHLDQIAYEPKPSNENPIVYSTPLLFGADDDSSGRDESAEPLFQKQPNHIDNKLSSQYPTSPFTRRNHRHKHGRTRSNKPRKILSSWNMKAY